MSNERVPLIVMLDDRPITGKKHMTRRPASSYEFRDTYIRPIDFRGVYIRLYSSEVSFFCGGEAVGDWGYHLHRMEYGLSEQQRKSIYRRTLRALREHLSETDDDGHGYKHSTCLLLADKRREIGPDKLSIWEMGHMLPCQRTVVYRNRNSNNIVRCFMFNP